MRNTCLLLALIAPIVVLYSLSSAQTAVVKNPKARISLAELQDRGVEGRLGVALGTVVELRGEVVENQTRVKETSADPYCFKVIKLNGEGLADPIDFPSSELFMSDDAAQFKIGDSFRLIGYESGSFEGAAPDEFKYVEPYATLLFHFQTRIRVLTASYGH